MASSGEEIKECLANLVTGHDNGYSIFPLWHALCPKLEIPMKARVHVSLKPSVLDPQGQTITKALHSLGHNEILDVRQGKYFDIELDPKASKEALAQKLQTISAEVLSNPVIEDFHIEVLG
jgi:phosphoribosylformylglycinamidine synthase PurS subunit